MVLLRRVIGDALRARRQGQHRTLREVSTAANVSLGYLSEIERGQKEASSELLAAICEALGARLSEVLGEVSGTLALAEGMDGVLAPHEPTPVETSGAGASPVPLNGSPVKRPVKNSEAPAVRQVTSDGTVSVSVRQESPLKATLHATRKRGRDVVYAA
ncbi:helix-turn-helix domain-containing protein [Actinoplanes auranticolor]|uniref:Transcriptional regulator n=1 Tax=Actinoplanes auranticolor TaxID=47988 RepID=A0A919SL91_9ACTN|nr:helix-turn-helix transcriptional regulator [Actinoplanes auranticolor]GIM73799.1 transcriptional regulator [Actinoplanes auranticolor]